MRHKLNTYTFVIQIETNDAIDQWFSGGPFNSPRGPQAKYNKLGVHNDILVAHDTIPCQNRFYC